jgi:hypothetical protein
VSASYTDGSFGLIVHGIAGAVDDDSDVGRELLDVSHELYGSEFWNAVQAQQQRERGRAGFSGWIEPRVMFAKR